ncbi:MAG: hypothetical protein ACOC9Y_02940 [Chloroflexota bacterium]
MNAADGQKIYVWLHGEPGVTEPDVLIDDVPGERDLSLVAEAIARGELGRYLPATLTFADRPDPAPSRARAVDVAKLLRDHRIRHRRRYEVIFDAMDDEFTPAPTPRRRE